MIRPIAFISALLLASPVFAIGDIDIRADEVPTDTVQEVNFRIAVKTVPNWRIFRSAGNR
ncbi:hypothetical protein BCF53_11393 [Reinekea marinisedimentorum]|uniref:Uncharacterized protein n=1 Tax=Reinekea marinisedimentorum TaxID=230495 RepID=A0A4R3I046_9GAMM|nr:hypothetical protein BCF53_11393 [Reinekea marinisedimentorum]